VTLALGTAALIPFSTETILSTETKSPEVVS
jgi:hypothetical protein